MKLYFFNRYKNTITIAILLSLISLIVCSCSFDSQEKTRWHENNSLKEDLLSFQNETGSFSTFINPNALYQTYYALLALQESSDEKISESTSLNLTKDWLKKLKPEDIMNDSTPIPDIYYYCNCFDLLALEIQPDMKLAILNKLDALYCSKGFFTFEHADEEILDAGFKDAANRSMTLLAIKSLSMLGDRRNYDKQAMMHALTEATLYYEDMLYETDLDDTEKNIALLNTINTLLDIYQVLNIEDFPNKQLLKQYIEKHWSYFAAESVYDDDLNAFYQCTGLYGLANKLDIEGKNQWIKEQVEYLLWSNDIYIVAQVLEMIEQNKNIVEKKILSEINDQILSSMQYDGSFNSLPQKNDTYTEISSTYYSYLLLKEEGWSANKRFLNFLKQNLKNIDQLDCLDQIFLLSMLKSENIIDNISENQIMSIVKVAEYSSFAKKIIIYYELIALLKKSEQPIDFLEKNIANCLSSNEKEFGEDLHTQQIVSSYQMILYSQFPCVWNDAKYLAKQAALVDSLNQSIDQSIDGFVEDIMYIYYMFKAIHDLGLQSHVNTNALKNQIETLNQTNRIRNLYTDYNSNISIENTYFIKKIEFWFP